MSTSTVRVYQQNVPHLSSPLRGFAFTVYNGLTDAAVKLENGAAALPEGLIGTVYAVASTSADRPNDTTTIAGPAIIQLENPDATYSDTKKVRRAIEFAA